MTKLINNVGSLIQMPHGCGEQNMVNFVPNIFVLEYLEQTGQGTKEQKANALKFMKKGSEMI